MSLKLKEDDYLVEGLSERVDFGPRGDCYRHQYFLRRCCPIGLLLLRCRWEELDRPYSDGIRQLLWLLMILCQQSLSFAPTDWLIRYRVERSFDFKGDLQGTCKTWDTFR